MKKILIFALVAVPVLAAAFFSLRHSTTEAPSTKYSVESASGSLENMIGIGKVREEKLDDIYEKEESGALKKQEEPAVFDETIYSGKREDIRGVLNLHVDELVEEIRRDIAEKNAPKDSYEYAMQLTNLYSHLPNADEGSGENLQAAYTGLAEVLMNTPEISDLTAIRSMYLPARISVILFDAFQNSCLIPRHIQGSSVMNLGPFQDANDIYGHIHESLAMLAGFEFLFSRQTYSGDSLLASSRAMNLAHLVSGFSHLLSEEEKEMYTNALLQAVQETESIDHTHMFDGDIFGKIIPAFYYAYAFDVASKYTEEISAADVLENYKKQYRIIDAAVTENTDNIDSNFYNYKAWFLMVWAGALFEYGGGTIDRNLNIVLDELKKLVDEKIKLPRYAQGVNNYFVMFESEPGSWDLIRKRLYDIAKIDDRMREFF